MIKRCENLLEDERPGVREAAQQMLDIVTKPDPDRARSKFPTHYIADFRQITIPAGCAPAKCSRDKKMWMCRYCLKIVSGTRNISVNRSCGWFPGVKQRRLEEIENMKQMCKKEKDRIT